VGSGGGAGASGGAEGDSPTHMQRQQSGGEEYSVPRVSCLASAAAAAAGRGRGAHSHASRCNRPSPVLCRCRRGAGRRCWVPRQRAAAARCQWRRGVRAHRPGGHQLLHLTRDRQWLVGGAACMPFPCRFLALPPPPPPPPRACRIWCTALTSATAAQKAAMCAGSGGLGCRAAMHCTALRDRQPLAGGWCCSCHREPCQTAAQGVIR